MRRHLEERHALIRAAVPGTTSARRLARLTDEMLVELAEGPAASRLPRRSRWSLIALGGYGAGGLLPASDLDLLLVSNAKPSTLKPFVETLLYPLWDAGLSVGHQVRSRREQIAAVRADTATLTATLTGRVIAGDNALGVEVLRACAADAFRRADEVIAALHGRPRAGSPYLLEPDLKDGAGGRRDFDELTWTAALLTGVPQSDPSPLVSLGLLEPEAFERLERSADVIAAARWEMHREGAGSLMTEEAAAELKTDPSLVQQALADTHHLLLRTRRRVIGRGRPDETPLSPVGFFDLVMQGGDSRPELEDAAWAGRLDHLVPGMSGLMCVRRPGIAHTLTVGAHSLACAIGVGDILKATSAGECDDPVLAASARKIADARMLAVAALTHDLGKVQPGPGHGERGAGPARCAAERFELSASDADAVATLVRHHLLLASASSRIDLDETSEVDAVAVVLGDRRLLPPLHLLTVADSRATGPGAWSAWHAALLGTLVSRLDETLAADRSEPRRDDDGETRRRVESMRARVRSTPTAGAYALDIGAGPIPGSFRVTVAALDRPGLLATISGTFALVGLDILSAHSSQSREMIAVDTFVVTSATLAPVGAETWSRLERLLSAALASRLALAVRLAERRRHYAPRVNGDIQTRIEEDGRAALLHVRAPDRVGLLYDIARAVAESGLDVRSLTATSRAGWAEDTFRLERPPGTGAGALGHLAMHLRGL